MPWVSKNRGPADRLPFRFPIPKRVSGFGDEFQAQRNNRDTPHALFPPKHHRSLSLVSISQGIQHGCCVLFEGTNFLDVEPNRRPAILVLASRFLPVFLDRPFLLFGRRKRSLALTPSRSFSRLCRIAEMGGSWGIQDCVISDSPKPHHFHWLIRPREKIQPISSSHRFPLKPRGEHERYS